MGTDFLVVTQRVIVSFLGIKSVRYVVFYVNLNEITRASLFLYDTNLHSKFILVNVCSMIYDLLAYAQSL